MEELPPELINEIVLYFITDTYDRSFLERVNLLYETSSLFRVLSKRVLEIVVDKIDLRVEPGNSNLNYLEGIFRVHPDLVIRYCRRLEENHKDFKKRVNTSMQPSNIFNNYVVKHYVCESCEWFYEVPFPETGMTSTEGVSMVYCQHCQRYLCTDCSQRFYRNKFKTTCCDTWNEEMCQHCFDSRYHENGYIQRDRGIADTKLCKCNECYLEIEN